MRQIITFLLPAHLALASLSHSLAAVNKSGLAHLLHAHSFTNFLGHLSTLQVGARILCTSSVVMVNFLLAETSTLVSIPIAPRLVMPMSAMVMKGFRFSRSLVVATIMRAITLLKTPIWRTIALLKTIALLETIALLKAKSLLKTKAKTFLKTIALLNTNAKLSVMSIVMGMEGFSFCSCIPLAIAIGGAIPIAWSVMMTIASPITLGMMAIVMEGLGISLCISFRFSRPLAIAVVATITSPIALGMVSVIVECLRISFSLSLVVTCICFRFCSPFAISIVAAIELTISSMRFEVMTVMMECLRICVRLCIPLAVAILATIQHSIVASIALVVMIAMVMEWLSFCISLVITTAPTIR